MRAIEFNNLSGEEKIEIIDKIVTTITTPGTTLKRSNNLIEGLDYFWLREHNKNTSLGIIASVHKNHHDEFLGYTKFIFYAPKFYIGREYPFYILTELPERILGLLAIIHRPMYEYYKKAMSEE